MNLTLTDQRIRIDTQMDPHKSEMDLEELRRCLLASPRKLPSKYFYDQEGSALFERITELPEYYPTRTEKALLTAVAEQISLLTGAEELVELGAGAATKTRVLLDAMESAGHLRLYVPFDVSSTEVQRVAKELVNEYPKLHVHGIVADFAHHLAAIPAGQPRLVILLGSTIGNYSPDQAVGLLSRLSSRMSRGDYLLLGTDLIKDVPVIERAYNDSAGITGEFNRNILRVVNRVSGADFDPEKFLHKAFYNHRLDRIEMYLVASESHLVEVQRLGLSLEIAKAEEIRTEISCKYDRARVTSMLEASGFELSRWFTDPDELFALALAQKS